MTLAANYLLIPLFGFMGSSWAAVICYGSMTVLCYVIGQRFYPIPYAIGKGLAYIAGTMLLVTVVNNLVIENLWLSVSFHAAVVAVFGVVVYFAERRFFRQPVI